MQLLIADKYDNDHNLFSELSSRAEIFVIWRNDFNELNIYQRCTGVISYASTKVTINATVYISFAYGTFGIQYIVINFTARSLRDKNIIILQFYLRFLSLAKMMTENNLNVS